MVMIHQVARKEEVAAREQGWAVVLDSGLGRSWTRIGWTLVMLYIDIILILPAAIDTTTSAVIMQMSK